MPILQLLVFLGSFVMIWYGAGKVVSAADKFSHKLKVSSFTFSFLVLGILTSTPEFAVGLTAVAEDRPEIYVGNLIGGIPVLFLFIIPILAVFGNGLTLKKSISKKNLLIAFITMLLPALFVLDGSITVWESIISIVAYLLLAFFIQKENGVLDDGNKALFSVKSYSIKDLLQVFFGIGLVFVASHYIVDGTRYIAEQFNFSTFFVSLILLSLGTNLPEISLAVKAIITKKKEVAFGDYVGSGAANTLLFGFFGIIYGKTAFISENITLAFITLVVGLFLFFIFASSKSELSRKEGLILIALFLAFGAIEAL